MQVTETNSDGLKREFKVCVADADLDARLNDRLAKLKDRVQIRGFRPGKVPVTHLRKVYGRAAVAETIAEVGRASHAKIVPDGGFKLAMDPKITMPESQSEIEGIIAGKSDLAYTVALEVVPKITLADFKQIALERLTAEVSDPEVEEAVGKIAEQSRPFGPKGEGGKAEKNDRVTVKFNGTIDADPFEGADPDPPDARACLGEPAEAQAHPARRARQAAQVRSAADPGGGGVQECVGHRPVRPEVAEPLLRGRGHDRGKGDRGVSRHRRPPGPARPGPCGNRRQEQYQGHRRRDHTGDRRAGAPVSTARAGSLGPLPQKCERGGALAGADFRGEGGGLYRRAPKGHRQAGLARGTLQGRRRRQGAAGLRARDDSRD